MKKNLVLGFLILFVLSTTAFAGLIDPKTESDKPAVANTKENRLSDEELSRMTKRAETDNLAASDLSKSKKSELKKNLNASKQVGHRHGGYYVYGGGGLLLLILIIIILL
jgi:hypothetical protein